MQEIWHSISYKGAILPGRAVLAEAHIDAASPWFCGHFPEEPILPGIAILSMVTDVIRHTAFEKGKRINITGIRRVRFRTPVRPDESLSISLISPDHSDDLSYHFTVEVNGDTACTGIMEEEPLL